MTSFLISNGPHKLETGTFIKAVTISGKERRLVIQDKLGHNEYVNNDGTNMFYWDKSRSSPQPFMPSESYKPNILGETEAY